MLSTRHVVRVLVLVCAASLLPASHAEANNRRDIYKSYDYNDDGKLKCKETKHFRKEKPGQFDNLMSFCEKASAAPKKNGVTFPKGEKAKKFKCKKSRIDKPYMKAWIADGPKKKKKKGDGNDDRPQHPQHP